MGAGDGDLLPQAVLRQIGDKLYEKRKTAALEVEQIVKNLAAAGEDRKIKAIVDKITADYAFSPQANYRKGALLCLAAATVGLGGSPAEEHLRLIVPPVLSSFTDQDARVRYYACEALYNIAKCSRDIFIIFFNEVFDAMFRLCADPEANVQSAVTFLDNLVKDIVAAAGPSRFSVQAFVPKLRDYLRVVNPSKRQFLISWISVLDSVPEFHLVAYLPLLLDGLMTMLSDGNREIRLAAHKLLVEFLGELADSPSSGDYPRLASILVDKAGSGDEFTRLTALQWLKELLGLAPPLALVGCYPDALEAVLPNVSHASKDIQQAALEANLALMGMRPEADAQLDTSRVLDAVCGELRSEAEPTRLEAITWVKFLLDRHPAATLDRLGVLLPALLDALSAPSLRVVLQALAVLAAVADKPRLFRRVLTDLLDRLRGSSGHALLRRCGGLAIQQLCVHLGASRVFVELAAVLADEGDLGWASLMVQALNLILLTSPEVKELRELLAAAAADPRGAQLFSSLYPCWSHSPAALLTLCFLARAYEHSCDVISSFTALPVYTDMLVQLDRLVQLLETPSFTGLRLQLLQPARHPALLRCMYGLLMLLPQSNAFRTLHTRLHSIPTLTFLQLDAGTPPPTTTTTSAPPPPAAAAAAAAPGAGGVESKAVDSDDGGREPSAGAGVAAAGPAQASDVTSAAAGSNAAATGAAADEGHAARNKDWADFSRLRDVFVARQLQHVALHEKRANPAQASQLDPNGNSIATLL